MSNYKDTYLEILVKWCWGEKFKNNAEMLAKAKGAQLVIEVRHTLCPAHVKGSRVVTENQLVMIDHVVVQDDFVTLAD